LRALAIAVRLLGKRVYSTEEFRVYRRQLADIGPPEYPLRVNEVADLLMYGEASPSDPDIYTFLAEALRRFEEGQVLFTELQGGRLVHWSWLIPSAASIGSDFGHQIVVDGTPAVLWDDFTHPAARGSGLHQRSIKHRLWYAKARMGATSCVIGVRADNGPSRHNIEKLGFEYYASAWCRRRLGRIKLSC
jgi:GNAT superfamily N-acetyltransferase